MNEARVYSSYSQPSGPKVLITPRMSVQSGSTAGVIPSTAHATSRYKKPVHLSYTSATPDFADLPVQNVPQAYRQETSYAPRYHGRNRIRAYSMAAHYGVGQELNIFPQIRPGGKGKDVIFKGNQQLPQLLVLPAPKHSRAQQKRKPSSESTQQNTQPQPQPIVVKRVQVSLHEVQHTTRGPASSPTHSNEENYIAIPKKSPSNAKALTQSPKEIVNLPLKSVDLNKGLHTAVAIKRKSRMAPKSADVTLEETLASRGGAHVMSLSHLPLKEVYLKPDPITGRENACRQQQDKTIRILRWLKDLKYLDEKTLQRGRSEVEKTHFQLPEINDSSIIGFV